MKEKINPFFQFNYLANPWVSCIIDTMKYREVKRQMNEEKLIQKAIDGDAQAFNELMAAHERRMYAVALKTCANREDAQDCLQEAMLRIYRSISSFKGQSSFSTWVYRITMNTCLDELRRRKNRPNTSLDNLLESGWSPSDDRDGPEKYAIRMLKQKKLMQFIDELPEDMRSAVVLRDIEGYAYEDIAEQLKANVGTIKSRISRGREKLREKILSHPELFDKYSV